MNRYIICFKSGEDVKRFLQSINPMHVEFNMKNNIVICACSDADLELARKQYGAEVDRLLVPQFG